MRRCSGATQSLIIKLNTLADRIDIAKKNNNAELVAYYEEEFTKVSTEFMTGVEVVVDDWYALNGQKRVRMANEPLGESALNALSAKVAEITGNQPAVYPASPEPTLQVEGPSREVVTRPEDESKNKDTNKLDIRG